jgi:hypothetical protein
MKQLLLNIQNLLATVPAFKYVDEDWGQLDDYGPHAPVQWPCCLIDFRGDYSLEKIRSDPERQEATHSLLTFETN